MQKRPPGREDPESGLGVWIIENSDEGLVAELEAVELGRELERGNGVVTVVEEVEIWVLTMTAVDQLKDEQKGPLRQGMWQRNLDLPRPCGGGWRR